MYTPPQIMADHTSVRPSESLPSPFSVYRLQTLGQRSTHGLFQNRLNQYGDSGLMCEPADNCPTSGTRVDEQMNPAYWDLESSVSSQPIPLNRTKALTGVYEEEWNSDSQQQDAMEDYGAARGNHQKLDSFSEAFYGRSISKMTSIGEYRDCNMGPNSSPPPLPSLSFPLVLSPPPTPLPPPSLSPPKRVTHLSAAQTVNHAQALSPSQGSLHFFPPLPCTSSVQSGSFPPTQWRPLSTDASGSDDMTQHLAQDQSPSMIYQEGLGFHLRTMSSTERDADYSLEISPCSPLAQNPLPHSITELQQEHDPVSSEDHMAWSQMIQSSQSFCPPLQQSPGLTEALRVHEDLKSASGFQRTNPLCLSDSQNNSSDIYTGVPFFSVLQSQVLGDEGQHTSFHYTPPPMLNPTRSGTGLFCNLLSPLSNRGLVSEQIDHHSQQSRVNIGSEFQAELPNLLEREEIEEWPKEPLPEELLWKPWVELEESDILQEHVENLLDLSMSAASPGGGANLELALHSLSICQGNMLAALEMFLFSNSTPSKDYHYTGRDVWRLCEQKLFHKAFTMYGKDFSFIQEMVKTKRVTQCVEFYYHFKRLQEKQRKQKLKDKAQQHQLETETVTVPNQIMMPSKMMINAINVERLIHTPSLATSFPCKQCGKMFYKIKSRNAHMKIHRQQQEDWKERIYPNNLTQARTLTHPNQLVAQTHQTQVLTQSILQNMVQSQAQLAFLQSSKTPNACFTTSIGSMGPTHSQQAAPKASVLPLYSGQQQTWSSLHGSLDSSLYYD